MFLTKCIERAYFFSVVDRLFFKWPKNIKSIRS